MLPFFDGMVILLICRSLVCEIGYASLVGCYLFTVSMVRTYATRTPRTNYQAVFSQFGRAPKIFISFCGIFICTMLIFFLLTEATKSAIAIASLFMFFVLYYFLQNINIDNQDILQRTGKYNV